MRAERRGERASPRGQAARDRGAAFWKPAMSWFRSSTPRSRQSQPRASWPNPLTTPGSGSSVKSVGDAEGRHRPGAEAGSWCWPAASRPGRCWPELLGARGVHSEGRAAAPPGVDRGRHHLVGAGGLGPRHHERMKLGCLRRLCQHAGAGAPAVTEHRCGLPPRSEPTHRSSLQEQLGCVP
jgi:hypothetical protein